MSRRESSQNRRRDSILEAASQVFASRDYAEVSIDDVAKQAGVARGTIYNYYGSKDQLYRQLLAQRLGELLTRLQEVLASEDDPVLNLRRCVVQPFLFFMKYPNLLLLWRREELGRIAMATSQMLQEDQQPKENIISHIISMKDQLIELVRGVLCEGIRANAFRSVDPESASHVILGAIEGMAGSLAGVPVDDPQAQRAKEELHGFVASSVLQTINGRHPAR